MQKQHGDIVIRPVVVGKKARKVDRDWVAEGEVTGHYHRVRPCTPNAKFEILEDPDLEVGLNVILRVLDGECEVYHPEHKPFKVTPGDYTCYPVREFDHLREMERNVID